MSRIQRFYCIYFFILIINKIKKKYILIHISYLPYISFNLYIIWLDLNKQYQLKSVKDRWCWVVDDSSWQEIIYMITCVSQALRAIAQLGRAPRLHVRQCFSGESSMQSKELILLRNRCLTPFHNFEGTIAWPRGSVPFGCPF